MRRRHGFRSDVGSAAPAADLFVLWGWHPDHGDEPIKIRTDYKRQCEAERRRRDKAGWLTAISDGPEPAGLRLKAEQRKVAMLAPRMETP